MRPPLWHPPMEPSTVEQGIGACIRRATRVISLMTHLQTAHSIAYSLADSALDAPGPSPRGASPSGRRRAAVTERQRPLPDGTGHGVEAKPSQTPGVRH